MSRAFVNEDQAAAQAEIGVVELLRHWDAPVAPIQRRLVIGAGMG